MSRYGFGASLRMIAREVARAERDRQRAQASREAATIRALRNAERQVKADAREAARLHIAAPIAEIHQIVKYAASENLEHTLAQRSHRRCVQ